MMRLLQVPSSRSLPSGPGPGSLSLSLGPSSVFQDKFLNLKTRRDVHNQSSPILQPPRQDSTHRRPSSRTSLGEADPGGFYRPGEDICSLQHVYNYTGWLRPRSPAHQQGPSMLTEAHRRSMLTAAYRQVYHLFRLCAP
ncbi:hypothetical protein YC2023_107915 [Brassica napus]